MFMRIVKAALLLCMAFAPLCASADVPDCVPGEVIVLFAPAEERGAAALDAFRTASAASAAGARVVETYSALSAENGGVFARLKSDIFTADELSERLAASDGVAAVMPNRIRRASFTPDDPGIPVMWGVKAANIREAWDITTGSDDVYIAVIDSGIDYEHPDLAANFDSRLSRNFYSVNASDFGDGHGHGTHVAGIAAAVGNNGRAGAGVSWNAKLISLRVLGRDGSGPISAAFSAFNYLIELLSANPHLKIAAVNMSSAYYDYMAPTQANQNKNAYYRALKTLSDMNRTLIVVAAGNEGIEVGVPAPADSPKGEYKKGQYVYEASFTGIDNMISVAAFDSSMQMPSYSNWSGSRVHIAAPGSRVFSTLVDAHNSSYTMQDGSVVGFLTGTSMAAPHVAGAAALIKSLRPDWDAPQIRDAILAGANRYYFADKTIYGALDVKAALDYAAAPVPSDETDEPSAAPAPAEPSDAPTTAAPSEEPPIVIPSYEPPIIVPSAAPRPGGGGGGGGCDAAGVLALPAFALFAFFRRHRRH